MSDGDESLSDNNDYYDDDDDYYDNDFDYYNTESSSKSKKDIEAVEFKVLSGDEVDACLNTAALTVGNVLKMRTWLAKMILHMNKWNANVVKRFSEDICNKLISSYSMRVNARDDLVCDICCMDVKELLSLGCHHEYCRLCWQTHVTTLIRDGMATGIQCMSSKCSLLCSSEMVETVLKNESVDLRGQYERFRRRDYVAAHPELRECSGADCDMFIYASIDKPYRVTCSKCKTSFCFLCGADYHVPINCEMLKSWTKKCNDDSETAHYLSANTKNCPKCDSLIEKNGGCNHMKCSKCGHDFCWMCALEWKTHGTEYYNCSKYKEQDSEKIRQEGARAALEKYLHYFNRFDNHHKSLQFEEEMLKSIHATIEDKVNHHQGTWIDWQYLLNAAEQLTKCRYTIKYTYPYAYYIDSGQQKELFEYQQAQLEATIEDLAWKLEHVEETTQAVLIAAMHAAEVKRRILLEDFFSSS
uniref:RBR-type E3 ubiquitin transferase n=1 Tax=Steinernema glaseri TaxID=37863 RepID=A0A1I7ZLB5_9BILA